MGKRILEFFNKDYIRIVSFSYLSTILFRILRWHITSATINKVFHAYTLELISTIPYVIFFLILGILLALILQKRLIIHSLLAGGLTTLMILINFPRFPYSLIHLSFSIFTINIFFPILVFPISALVMNWIQLKKRIPITAIRAATTLFGILFLAGLGQWIFFNYQFYSSASYKNSMGFEIAVYPESFDIRHITQYLVGIKSVRFKKEAPYLSYDIINYYNDFLQNKGFSLSLRGSAH